MSVAAKAVVETQVEPNGDECKHTTCTYVDGTVYCMGCGVVLHEQAGNVFGDGWASYEPSLSTAVERDEDRPKYGYSEEPIMEGGFWSKKDAWAEDTPWA